MIVLNRQHSDLSDLTWIKPPVVFRWNRIVCRFEDQSEGMLDIKRKLPLAIALEGVTTSERQGNHVRQRFGSLQLSEPQLHPPTIICTPGADAPFLRGADLRQLSRGEDYL